MRRRSSLLCALALLACSGLLSAQTQTPHPIDQRCNACLEVPENQTTFGMIDCLSKASEEWDAELNRIYKQLMSELSPKGKELLRTSQREWIKFRDAEKTFIGQMVTDLEGSMYLVMGNERIVEILRNRVLELQGHYDMLNPEN